MSKAQNNKVLNIKKAEKGSSKKNSRPKLIFVGENKLQIKKVEKFAQINQYDFLNYSEGEWVTLEEIDQYIQEEELSKQIINLPVGKRTVFSLDDLEAETIKKVIKNVNGNMMKAARTLKIARATLYRKMERYGLNLKEQREKQMKKQKEILKKIA